MQNQRDPPRVPSNPMRHSDGSGGGDRGPNNSFLELEESDADSLRHSEDIPILQRNDELSTTDTASTSSKIMGTTFEDLVDRLLALKMSKADNHFTDIFLCLYRKFAAPAELFSAILTRLDHVRDDQATHYLPKTATQLRMIEVVAKWVSLYPGDFARPTTRRNLEEFIKHLATEPIFCLAAQQMRRNLELNVMEDDDTGWAKSDDAGDVLSRKLLAKDAISLPDFGSFASLQLDDDSGRPSGSSDISHIDQGSAYSSNFQYQSQDENEREAATLEPSNQLPLNKIRCRAFMDMPDDDLAAEMTRIDWIMFSSIRIRDFVRHVSLTAEQKEKCKGLKNVNRMINHFNHIARWVAGMILLRDKAKHRALVLEKFMNLARELRILNNYNGLAAVLAGLESVHIHRLAQTRALVSPEMQKRFARLVLLMGTQKSYSTYRLAWENSPFPRIPFMPLHRRDLVSAEEGGKTLVGPDGDRINWKKFEVLGDVLLPLMKSQAVPYGNLTKNDAARELILDCKMSLDEEELYQRSVQVENLSGTGGDSGRRKFGWFQK